MGLAADFHRGAADGYHQHAAVFANGFIIDINADHRVGAQLFRLIFQSSNAIRRALRSSFS